MSDYRMTVQEQRIVCNFLLFLMELFTASGKDSFTKAEVLAVLNMFGEDPDFFDIGIFDEVKAASDALTEREDG